MKIINNSEEIKCDISAGVYFVIILNPQLLVFSIKNRVICLRIKIVQGKEQEKVIQNFNKFYTKNVVYKEVFESYCQQVMRKQGKWSDSGSKRFIDSQ